MNVKGLSWFYPQLKRVAYSCLASGKIVGIARGEANAFFTFLELSLNYFNFVAFVRPGFILRKFFGLFVRA